MSDQYFLVLDVGTTGVKALVFDTDDTVRARAYEPIAKKMPQEGWVEQDPDEFIRAARGVLAEAVKKSGVSPDAIISMGIANQRETVVAWDLRDGTALAPAIVWEDSRTEDWCRTFYSDSVDRVREKTGLMLTSTFSAPKIHWLLDAVPAVADAAAAGTLAVGTVDSWVLFSLSREQRHMTDITNASRTLLYNINGHKWDRELLELFALDRDMLPAVRSSRALYGTLDPEICGNQIPIEVICGDQQASMAAAGFAPRTTKITYGTGTFIMQTLGDEFVLEDPFITTLTPSASIGSVQYALEASVRETGSRVAGVLGDEEATERVLEDIVQEVDVLLQQLPYPVATVIVDGGISQSEYLVRRQGELSNAEIVRQPIFDGTALGVKRLLSSIHHGT
ncbi:MAG: FGGY family carbohydrate kinase [Candidatus Paceibacterota bacterium]